MKEIHISFEKLSDLCDNTFAAEEDREFILHHLNSCPICRLEYDCLRRTICLCAELRERQFNLSGLSRRTITIIQSRRKKTVIFHRLPSIAATIAIIAGAAVFTMDATHHPHGGMTYSAFIHTAPQKIMTDAEHIVKSIRDNRGKILSMTEFFIEGEVSPENFRSLKKQLGSRKVVYALISSQQGMQQTGDSDMFLDNIEAVSTTSFPDYSSSSGESVTAVRFRVFR